MDNALPYVAIGTSVVGSLVAWLVADARGKGRSDAQNKVVDALALQVSLQATKLAELTTSTAATSAALSALSSSMQAQTASLASVQVELGRSSQDRTGLHADVARLDAQKANRDAVDGIRTMLVDLRGDLDRRFDDLTSRVDRVLGAK
ncbi:MAG: hypothetical protein FJ096_02475 [Deltaproteobacteria bacterium]|nr:hypothetical protein [Deltaproteobacteria bacterium]